jgi:argininosuccinate synthase
LGKDPRLKTNGMRVKERSWLVPRINEITKKHTSEELSAKLEAIGMPFAPIAKPWDLLEDPHLNASGGLVETTIGAKTIRVPALPVALDGRRLGLVELLEETARVGARHGVGIVDQIEDRIVGLKVRDIYEVPAAAVILPAHQELERLVCTIHQNQFKSQLDRQWAYLVYAGLWWEPLRADLDAYMQSVNERVTGTIGVKLFKGRASVVTRSSPNAVYDAGLASFAQSGGLFSQAAAPGFIELFSLQSRMAWRLRNE